MEIKTTEMIIDGTTAEECDGTKVDYNKKWVAIDDLKDLILKEQFKGVRSYTEGCLYAMKRIEKLVGITDD